MFSTSCWNLFGTPAWHVAYEPRSTERTNCTTPHLLEVPNEIIDTTQVEVLLREYLLWTVPLFNKQNDLDVNVDVALAGTLSGLTECLPPDGCTVLARSGDSAANAVGFYRKIWTDAAETKRLYLRPEVRGEGLGRRLAQRLIDEARKSGYSELYFDSADFMSSAHSLYRSLGFRDVDASPEAEHPQDVSPHLIYMVRALD